MKSAESRWQVWFKSWRRASASICERATLTTLRKKKVFNYDFSARAVDGLNMVVPFGESEYYNLRRNIAVPKPNQTDGAVDLDGFFGLHPSLKPLEKFWQTKQLAVIHSAGSPDNTRSHFDAQDYMESATPGVKGTRDGWKQRSANSNRNSFSAVSMPTAPRCSTDAIFDA